jgi:hypothetical protein
VCFLVDFFFFPSTPKARKKHYFFKRARARKIGKEEEEEWRDHLETRITSRIIAKGAIRAEAESPDAR